MANEVETKNIELELFPKEEVEELKQVEVLIEKYKNGEKLPPKIKEYLKAIETLDIVSLLKDIPNKPMLSYITEKLPGATEIHIVCGEVVVKIDPKISSVYVYTIGSNGKRVWAEDIVKDMEDEEDNTAIMS